MDNKITIDIDEIRKMPNESVTDPETIRQISIYCIENRDITLANKIDGRLHYLALYPYVAIPIKLTKEFILKELNITGEVIAIFPYGSRVYGTAGRDSDNDFIIVMKSGMLDNGAFRNNAISNENKSIQGVVYSRGGFIDAINNYEIGALECLSLDPDDVILKKWPFKVQKWDETAMVKAIISKASASRHNADQQCKNGNQWIGKKGMYHALRILTFGLQLKEHQKIVDFEACNEMHAEMMGVEDEEFDTRDYYYTFDWLLKELRK
jgi:hypothetical protein